MFNVNYSQCLVSRRFQELATLHGAVDQYQGRGLSSGVLYACQATGRFDLYNLSAYFDDFGSAQFDGTNIGLLSCENEYEMNRKPSRSDEDLEVPINSQVNGRIHGGPIVVELGPDQVILAMVRADHTTVNECNGDITPTTPVLHAASAFRQPDIGSPNHRNSKEN